MRLSSYVNKHLFNCIYILLRYIIKLVNHSVISYDLTVLN